MILLCQVFMIQLLSGLCGGFGWLGFSAYTTTRKPRPAMPDPPVVYETPATDLYGYQPYKPSQRVYTVAQQPYQSFFHQAYTTTEPEPPTKNRKLTTKTPQLDEADPSPVSQIHQYQSHSEPAAYTRQPPIVTTTRPTTTRGSHEVTTRPATTRGSYKVTTIPTIASSYEVTSSQTTTRRSYEVTSRPTTTRGSYEVTTIPTAFTRQPVNVTTSIPSTTRGSHEVTTRPAASQYEPVTDQSPPFCHIEKKVEFLDQCETYKKETCNTLNKEQCSSQVLSDCRPVLETRMEEVCLNVTNKVCTLVESEERVQLEEVIFISSCRRGMEQVCDQSYKVEVTDQDEEVCVDLDTVNCIQESITVSDTVCVAFEFGCQEDNYMENSGCEKITKENCTSTPREVTVGSCQSTSSLCLNLTSQQAVPIMTEVCRDQPTVVCTLVEDVKPVERKVYTYSVSCDMMVKEECKMVEKVKLETSCSEKKRPVCEYYLGEEECVEEDKEFCHQVEKVVEVEVCDVEKAVSSLPSHEPVTSLPGYKPVTRLPGYESSTSLPEYKPVTSLPGYKPVTSLPEYKPVTILPGYKPVTTLPGYKP